VYTIQRVKLNKVCNIEDWHTDGRAAEIRRLLPYFLEQSADFPDHMEHRKHWEYAQILLGLDQLDVLDREAMVLSVAAGQEELVFELTNRTRWAFATDIYGIGPFAEREADVAMLRDPDSVARCPYNRRRLIVQCMDALDLRFEDETFDAVYSLSSIEHFGGLDGVRVALAEQRRVVKVGGIVAFTTEVIVNSAERYHEGHLLLSTPRDIEAVSQDVAGLELVEPIDFTVSRRTTESVIPLADAIADSHRGHTEYPHIVLELEGRWFTSVAVFLRRID
jgi:SAM-dependent methyltransferase